MFKNMLRSLGKKKSSKALNPNSTSQVAAGTTTDGPLLSSSLNVSQAFEMCSRTHSNSSPMTLKPVHVLAPSVFSLSADAHQAALTGSASSMNTIADGYGYVPAKVRSPLAVRSPRHSPRSSLEAARPNLPGGTLKRSRLSQTNLRDMVSQQQLARPPLSARDFETLTTIGCGSFGQVLLARRVSNGQPVAIKRLHKADVLRNSELAHLVNERQALSLFESCPFLVDYYGSYQDDDSVYFVLEFLPGGELFTLCVEAGRLHEEHARRYAAEVLLALEALHGHGYIYRDLKPENVMLDGQGHLRLVDFGFVRKLREGQHAYTICGTPEYNSPETILNAGHGFATDWWSLGILVYEMVAGVSPYAAQEPTQIYRKILEGRYPRPAGVSDACMDLIDRLLHQDPTQRLGARGAEEIRNHPWFQSVDWQQCAAKKMEMPFVPTLNGPYDTSFFPFFTDGDTPQLSIGTDQYILSPQQQALFKDF